MQHRKLPTVRLGLSFRPIVTPFEDRTVPAVVALWDFNSPVPDNNYATGTTVPAVGVGSLAAIGGTMSSYNLGNVNNGSSDPNTTDDTALNLVGFPAPGAASGHGGLELTVDTSNTQNVRFSFDQRNSNTASALASV